MVEIGLIVEQKISQSGRLKPDIRLPAHSSLAFSPTSPMKRHRHRKGQPGVVHFRRRSREGRGLADGLQCQPVEQKLPARPGNLGRDERALAVDAEADGDGAGSARPAGAGGEDAVP